jgi:hypothetical protein
VPSAVQSDLHPSRRIDLSAAWANPRSNCELSYYQIGGRAGELT